MKCENPCCRKETNLLFKIEVRENGETDIKEVCENCAFLSGMGKEEINQIKEDANNI